jgi:pterin-4a-carbinolamine dehydratase
MRSKLAEAARCSLNDDVKSMTAEQRLAAFLAHCQLMAQLASAGEAVQHRPRDAVRPNAN